MLFFSAVGRQFSGVCLSSLRHVAALRSVARRTDDTQGSRGGKEKKKTREKQRHVLQPADRCVASVSEREAGREESKQTQQKPRVFDCSRKPRDEEWATVGGGAGLRIR